MELSYKAISLDLLLNHITREKYIFTNNGFQVDYQIFIGENNYFSATFVIT